MEYQRIGAWRHVPAVSTDGFPFGGFCPGTRPGWFCWVVFGTLLGPEATGPGRLRFLAVFSRGLFVSGFLAAPVMRVGPFLGGCVWGVWYGVVV